MLELNKAMLTGRLTREPEYRSTSTGRAVATFSLAVNRRFKGADGQPHEEVDFIDVQAWERQAEFARNYLHKGNAVYVEGRFRQERWQDKDTGANRSKIVIVADRILFAETKAEAEQRAAQGGQQGGCSAPAPSGGYGNPPQTQYARQSAPEPRYEGSDEGQTEDDLPF